MTDYDSRCAYGACCTWWGSIYEVGGKPSGLPCCPRCGGTLFEMDTVKEFLDGAQTHEADGHPGYVAFIEWSRGKCFKSFEAAQAAHRVELGE